MYDDGRDRKKHYVFQFSKRRHYCELTQREKDCNILKATWIST